MKRKTKACIFLLVVFALIAVGSYWICYKSFDDGYCVTYEVTSDTFEGIFYRSEGRSFEAVYYLGTQELRESIDVENIRQIGNYWIVVIEDLEPNTEYNIATFVESFAFTTKEKGDKI